MNRKTRRIYAKLNKKKNMTIRERNEIFRQQGVQGMAVSFCSEHGPYTPDNLCACYDEGGDYEGVNYEDIELDTSTVSRWGVCPIHGSYTPDDLCPCYDENGERKPDWNKDIVDEPTEWN